MEHRRVLVAVLLGAVFSASCAEPPSGALPSSVTIGTTADIGGVNELVSGGARFTTEVLDQLLVHLFEEQPDWSEHPPSVAPSLAESWQSSADGREMTIRLRPELRWSDGAPITAEDVRFSFEAQRSSDEFRALGFPGADELGNMWQFKRDFETRYCARRDLARVRELHPGIADFATWLRANASRLPIARSA